MNVTRQIANLQVLSRVREPSLLCPKQSECAAWHLRALCAQEPSTLSSRSLRGLRVLRLSSTEKENFGLVVPMPRRVAGVPALLWCLTMLLLSCGARLAASTDDV